ncbi:DUF6145 family protein [Zhenhengia yiwuensis]|jgi:phosphoribosyl-ATP pyrophosphohydrolase|uniref:DUF6145 family protein n=1 Tax=Zhenhengia yiwuensis TaxID=2763666 RepID=UPI002A757BFC|nr:DUF6145 family protein [Zhenhengia yiwuensis]MBS5800765.1 hypothetical protein [Clostridiales bacterium]MDY3366570.1 DUF6145 family protein [Zhenhengia yiwuensis]
MEKTIVISASPYNHKYYFEPSYNDIPSEIQEELIESIAAIAEKVNAIISLGFDEVGHIFIEQTADESVFADDIGAELEIKRFQKEKDELLKSLQLWYMIYRSEQGQIVKEIVLMQSKGLELEDILDEIETKYGEEARVFAEQVLD